MIINTSNTLITLSSVKNEAGLSRHLHFLKSYRWEKKESERKPWRGFLFFFYLSISSYASGGGFKMKNRYSQQLGDYFERCIPQNVYAPQHYMHFHIKGNTLPGHSLRMCTCINTFKFTDLFPRRQSLRSYLLQRRWYGGSILIWSPVPVQWGKINPLITSFKRTLNHCWERKIYKDSRLDRVQTKTLVMFIITKGLKYFTMFLVLD